MELLLPSTDRGVAVQAVIAGVVFTASLVAARRNRDLRVFVTGVGVLVLAWFGLRAVH